MHIGPPDTGLLLRRACCYLARFITNTPHNTTPPKTFGGRCCCCGEETQTDDLAFNDIVFDFGDIFIFVVVSLRRPSPLLAFFAIFITAADSGDHLCSVHSIRLYATTARVCFSNPSLSLVTTDLYFYVSLLHLTTTAVPPRSARPLPLPGGRRYTHYDMLWISWAPLVSLLLVLSLGVALSPLVDRRAVSYLHVLIGLVCVLVGSTSFLPLDYLSPYAIWMNTAFQAHLKDLDRFCEEHARMILFGAAVIWYGSPPQESQLKRAR